MSSIECPRKLQSVRFYAVEAFSSLATVNTLLKTTCLVRELGKT